MKEYRIIFNKVLQEYYLQCLVFKKKYYLFGKVISEWKYITRTYSVSDHILYSNDTKNKVIFYELSVAKGFLRNLEDTKKGEIDVMYHTKF